jgi:hypothetical protein
VTKIIFLTIINLVTPKAGARHELLFNKPASGLLNESSFLAPAFGVTKFILITDMIFSHFVVLLKSDLGVQQTHLSSLMSAVSQT